LAVSTVYVLLLLFAGAVAVLSLLPFAVAVAVAGCFRCCSLLLYLCCCCFVGVADLLSLLSLLIAV
jgi:hypothetical protein